MELTSVAEPPLFRRLRKSEVPEPTSDLAPAKLARLRYEAKKGCTGKKRWLQAKKSRLQLYTLKFAILSG